MKRTVYRTKEGWFCFVHGHEYGPWPMREYAVAGAQVEERRIMARLDKIEAPSLSRDQFAELIQGLR